MATVVPRFVLLWALLLATSPDGARGFSLPEMPADRRPAAARGLAEEEEPCSSSCDATKTNECDVASPNDPTNFEFADGASSCDLHPSTSCDRDCAPSPSPPPRNPWPHSGTWPSAPPPAPPPNVAPVVFWTFLAALSICICCCVCIIIYYGRARKYSYARTWLGYWCCCCLPCFKWEAECEDARNLCEYQKTKTPPAGQRPSGIPGIPMQEEVPLDTAPSFDKRQFSGSI